MSEKLIIRNFGPIKDVALDLKRIMIFIGPQASGKSTIAKLLAIFNNPGFLQSIDKSSFNDAKRDLFDPLDYLSLFKEYHLQSFFKEDSFLSYQLKNHQIEYSDRKFKLTIDESFAEKIHNSRISLLRKLNESKNGIRTNVIEEKEDGISIEIGFTDKELEVIRKIISDKFLDYAMILKKTVYIPAERFFISLASGLFMNLITNNVPIAKNILNFGADFEKARNEVSEVDIQFLKAKYKYTDNQDKIILNDGLSMPLLESSSGFQALVPLMVVVNWEKNNSKNQFLIEEPELNLFPETQKNLINYLVSSCSIKRDNLEIKSDLFITTHSPYVLTSINNLLFAYRVSKKYPGKLEEVAKVIPQDSWLNPEDFNAYFIKDGMVRNIFNEKVGMISENELDNASEEINNEFGLLMEIYKSRS